MRAFSRLVLRFWTFAEAIDHDRHTSLDHAHIMARILTCCFYVGLTLIAFHHMSFWHYYVGLREIQPLWPVAWAVGDSGRPAMAILLLFVVGPLLAAAFPDRLAARSLAFAGCLEFSAFANSFGTIRHVHHLLILTTFMLIFLPRVTVRDEEAKRAYLRAFWGVQCAALLTYSMSGFAKIAGGLWFLLTRKEGVLIPSAFALHVANSGIRFGVEPPLGALAIRWGSLGLPLYLTALYLEACSLLIAFRPRLHRLWGAALIVMHVAIALTLNLFFFPSILVLGVFLLASPFAPESPDWRRTARDLPLIGRLLPGARPIS